MPDICSCECHENGDITCQDCCRTCDNCGYVVDISVYRDGIPARNYRFCEVCAFTLLSSATIYPLQCPDPRLHKGIAWIANKILEELKKKK